MSAGKQPDYPKWIIIPEIRRMPELFIGIYWLRWCVVWIPGALGESAGWNWRKGEPK